MLSSGDILAILQRVRELGYRRFRFESGDLVLEVDTESGSTQIDRSERRPHAAAEPRPELQPQLESQAINAGQVAITAPMSGTFYRAPAPNAAPFVEVGKRVLASDTVCMIEVMKLFNTIVAGVDGTIVEIVAENEQPVVTGQPVIWIKPD